MRTQILDAAASLTVKQGWATLTMARVAAAVGVSRQTVYNEFGAKPALAQAIVMRELDRFLRKVVAAFDAHPDDPVEGIRSAVYDVLVFAEHNDLLHAALTKTDRSDNDLLALLTNDSAPLLDSAKRVVAAALSRHRLPVSSVQLEVCIDLVVRSILSHVVVPSGTPREIADGIAWASSQLLRADHPAPAAG